ncbi:hypothetical protein V4F39_17740 [Aquincola sp. MAHUQ-54]|uniref:Uncharacterized protein n=1 Tax=Aquincola agrisoli TaxID=3119538 RepID=A0AAW9Q7M2_9BURK
MGDGALQRLVRHQDRFRHAGPALPGRDYRAADMSAQALHFTLLGRFGPASVVLGAQHEVIHLPDNAYRFLRMPEREPTCRLVDMVLPACRGPYLVRGGGRALGGGGADRQAGRAARGTDRRRPRAAGLERRRRPPARDCRAHLAVVERARAEARLRDSEARLRHGEGPARPDAAGGDGTAGEHPPPAQGTPGAIA